MIKYCEDDQEIVDIVSSVRGDKKDVKGIIDTEKIEKYKSHRIVEKMMCYIVAYGCPKCSYWPRSFVKGNCPYCGRTLVKRNYWSPAAGCF